MKQQVKPRRAYNTTLRSAQSRDTRRRIAESARTLYLARGYSAVTMADIAKAAGVAYQTVYAAFGNKLQLTQEIIWTTFEVAGVGDLLAEITTSSDPEHWLRSGARISRLVGDRIAGLLRFLQESGDPDLLAEYQRVQSRRREQETAGASRLYESGRLRAGLSPEQALDILWVLTGTHLYEQLVVQRGWSADTYERWLGDTLIAQLLVDDPAY